MDAATALCVKRELSVIMNLGLNPAITLHLNVLILHCHLT